MTGIFNWSGGKDSALALYKVLQSKQYEQLFLLTSINKTYNRISMHGVRTELLELQAERLKLPLVKMELPEEPSMEEYEQIMSSSLTKLKNEGATVSIFGDIFLEDLRAYRENKLAAIALKAVFPLWKKDTTELIHEFLDLGFKTIVTCVNAKYLGQDFAGRIIDKDFLKDLPANVDPCGENGEFHTFVYDGPLFGSPVDITVGEKVYREYGKPGDPTHAGFWFCDILSTP